MPSQKSKTMCRSMADGLSSWRGPFNAFKRQGPANVANINPRETCAMALRHAKPGEIVDLTPMGPGIKNAKSSAIIKGVHFEAIHLIVRAGAEISEHEVPGNITLHCLEGRVELGLETSTIELEANQWVYLDGGASHSVRGIENSSLLLTIFFDQQTSRS